MARPKKNPPTNAIEIIKEVASRGCAERSIAFALGVDYQTWQRWREEDPSLRMAYEEGRAREHDTLVGILFEKATKGDTVAAMFLLKCRHNYRDGGITVEDNRQIKVGIMLPQSLKPEQYQQIIDTTATEVTEDE